MNELSIARVGGALTVLGVVTYVLCFLGHLLVPAAVTSTGLQSAFPGFSWSGIGFLIGLGWIIVYSVYTAVVFVPAYNVLGRLGVESRTRGPRQPVH